MPQQFPLGFKEVRERSLSMRLQFNQQQQQIQTHKLAPKMIQSMEILQLPVMALQERVEQEINDNPMIELEEEEASRESAEEKDDPNKTEDERELVVQDDQSNTEDFERLANMDGEMPNTFDDFRTSATQNLTLIFQVLVLTVCSLNSWL